MSLSSSPCGWEPCEENEVVNLEDVLVDIAKHQFETVNPVFDPNNHLYMDEPILKFKKLSINEFTSIEFDLLKDNNFYALVIEHLEIVNGRESNIATFQWHKNNLKKLYRKLIGSSGKNASQPSGLGKHGLPGGKGGRGKTRHSPSVFLFVKEVTITDTNIDLSSFDFSLKGIPGGWGGQGGDGSNGNEGARGKHGRLPDWPWQACDGGKNGKRGGQPGKGGQGGDGGCGGNGPELIILFDNEDTWKILKQSKYDVSGADPNLYRGNERAPGYAGPPGEAGEPGIGGKGGKRAGDCSGGNRGPSGEPAKGTKEWKEWNYGFGLPGTAGLDGEYNYDVFTDYQRQVFYDPNNQP